MRFQIKNRVIQLDAIAYAEITFPDEDTANDWIELLTIIDGKEIIFTGDEALMVWQALSRNTTGLQTPTEAIAGAPVITSDYGTATR